MDNKKYMFASGIFVVCMILFSSISFAEEDEKEDNMYSEKLICEYALIFLDCDSISGIQDDEYIGQIRDFDVIIEEFTVGLIISSDGDTEIIESEDSFHLTVNNYYGLTQLYSNGSGKILGLGKDVEWEKI